MNPKKDNELVELAAKICVESHAEQTDKVANHIYCILCE